MTEAERGRADDDGMAQTRSEDAAPRKGGPGVDELLQALVQLSLGSGEQDERLLRRCAETVTALRTLPGATEPFRAKVASAGGWAALLFSSWRHRKYDRANESGAARARQFIARDRTEAGHLIPPDPLGLLVGGV